MASSRLTSDVGAATDPVGQTLTVERCVPGGDGLARCEDGRIVFVPGAFAGDVVRLQATTIHSGFVRATQWETRTPSPERRAAPCPIAARCGGCDWMSLEDAAQGNAKLELLQDALIRVGQIDPLPPLRLTRSAPLGYRSRLRLHVSPEGGLGLLAKGTHQLVDVASCAVASDGLNTALTTLRTLFDPSGKPPERPIPSDVVASACEAIAQVELRALAKRPELLIYPRATTGGSPRRAKSRAAIPDPWLRAATASFEVLVVGAKATTSQAVSLPLAGQDAVTLRISPDVFTQVNWQVNSALVGDLLAGVRERDIETFLDVYCGVGNFTLPLLAAGLRGKAVESNRASVNRAREAAAAQRLDGSFVCADAARFTRQLKRAGERFDVVLVDPPRAGIKPLVDDVAALASEWIFYCACDPVSFARDAKQLARLGFETVALHAYDMFPQTHHVELAAWLRKPRARTARTKTPNPGD